MVVILRSPTRVLVIQGLQDRLAPPENGRRYVAEVAQHATLCEIDGAGHALLPERPDEIANALIALFERRADCTLNGVTSGGDLAAIAHAPNPGLDHADCRGIRCPWVASHRHA